MEPVHDDLATNKFRPSSHSIMRPNISSSSSSSSPPPTNSGLPKPKLPLLTPPTTPSSPPTAFPRPTLPLSSHSSSLSTPPASPLRQPIRSPSTVGRSQLNAATENTGNDSTPAGAAAKPLQPHPLPEQGEM